MVFRSLLFTWISRPKDDFNKNISDSTLEYANSNNVFLTTVDNNLQIDSTRFFSWNRLVSSTTRVLEAVNIWRHKKENSVDCKIRAEKICLQLSQVRSFPEEIIALKNSNSVSKNSKILSLNPFIDKDGILYSESRLVNFSLNEFLSKPMILDGKHYIVRLLIKYYHNKFYHANHETVVNELRQRYWIVGLRQTLRSIVSSCSICKFLRGSPVNPKMAALLLSRLGYRLQPFAHCGLDYFGPIMVKIGRRQEKRWGALFTCLTIRAIHIELVHSLSTDSTIMAIKRFIARRGAPFFFKSDNATNFKGASKELLDAVLLLDHKVIENSCSSYKIKWYFNPPSAPHLVGAWERMVSSVKTALHVVLREHVPKEEVLGTILAVIEHSINSRPLTHVSIDPRDNEALTPNHFLIGKSSGEIRSNRLDVQLKCTRK